MDNYYAFQFDEEGSISCLIVNRNSKEKKYFKKLSQESKYRGYFEFPMNAVGDTSYSLVDGEYLNNYKENMIQFGDADKIPEELKNIENETMYLLKYHFIF
jgi:hypothetical protein